MEYVMLMIAPREKLGDQTPQSVVAAVREYAMRLAASGRLKDGRQLQSDALGFRVESDAKAGQVVDGPFADTKELVGGYFVIECDSLEEAKRLAIENPHRRIGSVVMVPAVPRRV